MEKSQKPQLAIDDIITAKIAEYEALQKQSRKILSDIVDKAMNESYRLQSAMDKYFIEKKALEANFEQKIATYELELAGLRTENDCLRDKLNHMVVANEEKSVGRMITNLTSPPDNQKAKSHEDEATSSQHIDSLMAIVDYFIESSATEDEMRSLESFIGRANINHPSAEAKRAYEKLMKARMDLYPKSAPATSTINVRGNLQVENDLYLKGQVIENQYIKH